MYIINTFYIYGDVFCMFFSSSYFTELYSRK